MTTNDDCREPHARGALPEASHIRRAWGETLAELADPGLARRVRRRVSRPLWDLGRKQGAEVPFRTAMFWGRRMRVWYPDIVSMHLFRDGFYEEGLTTFFTMQIGQGMTVFDIGAHFGYFTMLAADLVGEQGRVVAFEPTPRTIDTLQKNVGSRPQVTIRRAAVWSTSGQLKLRDFGPRSSAFNTVLKDARSTKLELGRGEEITVDALPIDRFVREHRIIPDFVKIDAESAEQHVLQGMYHTLQDHSPMVTLEVGDVGVAGAARSSALIESLEELGYVSYEYVAGAVIRHRKKDHYDYDNLLFVRGDDTIGET